MRRSVNDHLNFGPLSRRRFVGRAAAFAGWALTPRLMPSLRPAADGSAFRTSAVTIERVDSTFEREPLKTPFGFKGAFMSNVWQTVALMESSSGRRGIGLGTQNTLWSDSAVFAGHSENGSNALMYAVTASALRMVEGGSFETPIDLLDRLFEPSYAFAKSITDRSDLRKTFALNALVAVDNAAWILFALERGTRRFDDLIPERYRPGLSYRHRRVASVPAFGYASTRGDLEEAARDGYFIMKIKIGHPGTQREMLEKDMEWLSAIHDTLGDVEFEDGHVPYYLDANGRYESKDAIGRLLDHARQIGAFDRIIVLEEPFPEDYLVEVGDLGLNVAADESAHTVEDVIERIELGYGSIALKPIAKTMSMTLKMAKAAHDRGVPCFCADLTVNPILLDWNKIIAARLPPLPGLDLGLMEANGRQNYAGWPRMESYHPCPEASWRHAREGVFPLDDDFYERSGCIFDESEHYASLFSLPPHD